MKLNLFNQNYQQKFTHVSTNNHDKTFSDKIKNMLGASSSEGAAQGVFSGNIRFNADNSINKDDLRSMADPGDLAWVSVPYFLAFGNARLVSVNNLTLNIEPGYLLDRTLAHTVYTRSLSPFETVFNTTGVASHPSALSTTKTVSISNDAVSSGGEFGYVIVVELNDTNISRGTLNVVSTFATGVSGLTAPTATASFEVNGRGVIPLPGAFACLKAITNGAVSEAGSSGDTLQEVSFASTHTVFPDNVYLNPLAGTGHEISGNNVSVKIYRLPLDHQYQGLIAFLYNGGRTDLIPRVFAEFFL